MPAIKKGQLLYPQTKLTLSVLEHHEFSGQLAASKASVNT
jgi:hypothetical protein